MPALSKVKLEMQEKAAATATPATACAAAPAALSRVKMELQAAATAASATACVAAPAALSRVKVELQEKAAATAMPATAFVAAPAAPSNVKMELQEQAAAIATPAAACAAAPAASSNVKMELQEKASEALASSTKAPMAAGAPEQPIAQRRLTAAALKAKAAVALKVKSEPGAAPVANAKAKAKAKAKGKAAPIATTDSQDDVLLQGPSMVPAPNKGGRPRNNALEQTEASDKAALQNRSETCKTAAKAPKAPRQKPEPKPKAKRGLESKPLPTCKSCSKTLEDCDIASERMQGCGVGAGGTVYCLRCTEMLRRQRQLRLRAGDFAWCCVPKSGESLAVRWPAAVIGIVFASPSEPRPYVARFFHLPAEVAVSRLRAADALPWEDGVAAVSGRTRVARGRGRNGSRQLAMALALAEASGAPKGPAALESEAAVSCPSLKRPLISEQPPRCVRAKGATTVKTTAVPLLSASLSELRKAVCSSLYWRSSSRRREK